MLKLLIGVSASKLGRGREPLPYMTLRMHSGIDINAGKEEVLNPEVQADAKKYECDA